MKDLQSCTVTCLKSLYQASSKPLSSCTNTAFYQMCVLLRTSDCGRLGSICSGLLHADMVGMCFSEGRLVKQLLFVAVGTTRQGWF